MVTKSFTAKKNCPNQLMDSTLRINEIKELKELKNKE